MVVHILTLGGRVYFSFLAQADNVDVCRVVEWPTHGYSVWHVQGRAELRRGLLNPQVFFWGGNPSHKRNFGGRTAPPQKKDKSY